MIQKPDSCRRPPDERSHSSGAWLNYSFHHDVLRSGFLIRRQGGEGTTAGQTRPAGATFSSPPCFARIIPPCDCRVTAPCQATSVSNVARITLVTAVMSRELLSSQEAARRLGISPTTLYDWLAQSNAGTFMLRGQPVTIRYYQTGRRGQGRIKIECQEVERLLALMRVSPTSTQIRRPPSKKASLNHITTRLARPED